MEVQFFSIGMLLMCSRIISGEWLSNVHMINNGHALMHGSLYTYYNIPLV